MILWHRKDLMEGHKTKCISVLSLVIQFFTFSVCKMPQKALKATSSVKI